MSHRDTHRVRTSHYDRIDQEAATRIMTREWRSATPRRETPAVVQYDGEPPALVHDRLARDAVVPDALTVRCVEHDAEPGAYCFRGAHGVCGTRLDLRPRHA